LLCHCEHCGVRRVPGFHIRRWLAQAHRIVLPGLNGWLVVTTLRVPRPRSLAARPHSREWPSYTIEYDHAPMFSSNPS
jgi:hypothetical protein